MGVSDLVQYEREFPLELVHPATLGSKRPKKLGITFMVKHIDCDAATEVVRAQGARAVLSDDNPADDTRAVYAACISGWDWGGQEFEDGKGVLPYSPENALHVIRHPGAKWILRQVMDAVVRIGNFTDA